MINRAFYIGIIYSVAVIIFKLIILLGGFAFSHFGFNYSHVLSVFLIVPFMIVAIRSRRNELGGMIGGREAVSTALKVMGPAVIILSLYNYVEFEWKWKYLALEYYGSKEFYQSYLDYYATHSKAVKIPYNTVLYNNLSGMSAMKLVTVRLFSFVFISLSSAVICGMIMKKSN